MNKFVSLFEDRPLKTVVSLLGYFVLVYLVSNANQVIQTIAGLVIAVLLLCFVIRVVIVLRKRTEKATGCCQTSPWTGLTPIGFLALAAVQAAPDSDLRPILYGFIGFFALVYVVSFFVARKTKNPLSER